MSPSWQSLAGEATEQRDLARQIAVCLEQENAELRQALNEAVSGRHQPKEIQASHIPDDGMTVCRECLDHGDQGWPCDAITVPDEDAQIRSYLPEGEAPF